MKELVFATNNGHKIEEVKAILGDRFILRSLEAIGCDVDIPETGNTFEENALQKSSFVNVNYGLDCFADDSGLVVESLNNEPGVYSARYSGSRDMEKNISLLLHNLQGVKNRNASFITVISLIIGGQNYYFEGRIDGQITEEKRGEEGFGYDPIFIPNGFTKSFAQMTAEEKNTISHRALAVKKLADFLLGR